MRKRTIAAVLGIFGLAGPVSAEVSVLYSTTTLAAGSPTDITLTFRDETGAGLEIIGIILDIVAPAGIQLNEFRWLSGFDAQPDWLFTTNLPKVETASFAGGVDVPADGTLVFAVLTVTADASLVGSVATLEVLPDTSDSAIVQLQGVRELLIDDGRSVDLFVTAASGDGSDGGGDGGGTGGGGTGGGGTGDGADSGGDDADNGNANQSDDGDGGTGDSINDNGTSDANDNSHGDSDDGDPGNDNDNGNDNSDVIDTPNDNSGGDQPTDSGDGTDGGGDQSPGGDSGDDGAGADEGGGAAPPRMPCGAGMISFTLFTLTSLSVMTFLRRRRP